MLRRIVVGGSGIVYWAGVLINASRVRRKIGRTPNLRPRGLKEKLLWAGWFVVIAGWILQPFWLRRTQLLHPGAPVLGTCLISLAYVATLWTYAVMGTAWRIGINPQEKAGLITRGPFRWIRHPIYAFQVAMLTGALLLLPTDLSLVILVIHLICVLIKSHDEELHLEKMYGDDYREYEARTGGLFPKLKGKTN